MSTERDKRVSIRALLDSGMSVSAVARQTGANRRTVMRVRDEGDAAIERKRHERQNSARSADLVAQELTPAARRKRHERCCALINRLKGPDAAATILFQDEKFFTLAQYHNRQNSKVILRQGHQWDAPDERFIGTTQRPAGVMFFGAISSDGRVAPPIFVEPGLKINAPAYQDLIRRELLPWVEVNFAPGTFIYQQDSAPAHAAASTQDFFRELGWRFWTKDQWPAHSPDLAPLDYGIWDLMERKSCAEPAPSLDVLRERVAQAWLAQTPDFIRRVCRGFRRRLEACAAAQGGHIEF